MIKIFILVVILSLSACGEDSVSPPIGPVEPTPPIIEPTPTPEPVVQNPLCMGEMSTRDGGGGFTYKPESENPRVTRDGSVRKTAVALFPGTFQSVFERVIFIRKNGQEEEADFTGFANADPNGLRQHWRPQFTGERYEGTIKAFGGNPSQECVWRLRDASKRQD